MEIGLKARVEPEVDDREARRQASALRSTVEEQLQDLETAFDFDDALDQVEEMQEVAEEMSDEVERASDLAAELDLDASMETNVDATTPEEEQTTFRESVDDFTETVEGRFVDTVDSMGDMVTDLGDRANNAFTDMGSRMMELGNDGFAEDDRGMATLADTVQTSLEPGLQDDTPTPRVPETGEQTGLSGRGGEAPDQSVLDAIEIPGLDSMGDMASGASDYAPDPSEQMGLGNGGAGLFDSDILGSGDDEGSGGGMEAVGGTLEGISGKLGGLKKGLLAGGATVALGGLALFALSEISDTIGQLAQNSPLLEQILSMFTLAMSLFFRPFGNLVGQALAPVATAALQLAANFNSVFGQQGITAALAWLAQELLIGLIDGFYTALQAIGQFIISNLPQILAAGILAGLAVMFAPALVSLVKILTILGLIAGALGMTTDFVGLLADLLSGIWTALTMLTSQVVGAWANLFSALVIPIQAALDIITPAIALLEPFVFPAISLLQDILAWTIATAMEALGQFDEAMPELGPLGAGDIVTIILSLFAFRSMGGKKLLTFLFKRVPGKRILSWLLPNLGIKSLLARLVPNGISVGAALSRFVPKGLGVGSILSRLVPSIGGKSFLSRLGLGAIGKILGGRLAGLIGGPIGALVMALDLLVMAVTWLIPGMEMWSPIFDGIIPGLIWALGALWDATKWVIGAFLNLPGLLADLLSGGLDLAVAFGSLVADLGGMLLNGLFALPGMIVGGLKRVVTGILTGILGAIGSIVDLFVYPFSALIPLFKLTMSLFTPFILLGLKFWNWVQPKIQKVSDWLGSAVDWLRELWYTLKDLSLSEIAEMVWEWLKGKAVDVWEFIEGKAKEVWEWIKGAPKAVWEWIKDTSRDIWHWITDKARAIWHWITDKAHAVWNWITDNARDLWFWITDNARDLWHWLTDKSRDLWYWITNNVRDLWYWITNKARDIWHWVTNKARDVWHWITNKSRDLWHWISDKSRDLWHWITDKTRDLWHWLTDKSRDIWHWITENGRDVWYWISDNTRNLWHWITDNSRSVWGWITTNARSVWNWITTNARSVWDWISTSTKSITDYVTGNISVSNIVSGSIDIGSYVVGSITGSASGRVVKRPSMSALAEKEPEVVVPFSKLDTFVQRMAHGASPDQALPSPESGELPALAEGGVATDQTLAWIGEGSESEAVLPLSKLDSMVNNDAVTSALDELQSTLTEGVQSTEGPSMEIDVEVSVQGAGEERGGSGGSDQLVQAVRTEMQNAVQSAVEQAGGSGDDVKLAQIEDHLSQIVSELRRSRGDVEIHVGEEVLASTTREAMDDFMSEREVTK